MTPFLHSTTVGSLYMFTRRVAILTLALSLALALGMQFNTRSASADVGNTAGRCNPAMGNGGTFQPAPARITVNNRPMVMAENLTSGVDTQTFVYTLFLYYWSGVQWLPVRDMSGNPYHGPFYSVTVSEGDVWKSPQSVGGVGTSEVEVDIPSWSGYYFMAADELWEFSKDTGKLLHDSQKQWVNPLTQPDGSTSYYCKF